MNIEFNEDNKFVSIHNSVCKPANGDIYNIKPELGEGTIEVKRINENVAVVFIDIKFNQPIITKWNFKSEDKEQFYFINNLSDKQDIAPITDIDTIEEGAVFFTQNTVRRRLWMPNILYSAKIFIIDYSWLKKINLIFPFPKEISSFIKNTTSIYLNADISTKSRLALKQISETNKYNNDNTTLLELKTLEMIYYFFENVFSIISTSKKNLAIHPDDLSKMNNFINSLNTIIDKLPSLKEAASLIEMSESKFQRMFKKIYRKTYYSYILELRMNYAIELLMGKMSVSQVAMEIGYSSVSNFTIAFKRHLNFLPSDV